MNSALASVVAVALHGPALSNEGPTRRQNMDRLSENSHMDATAAAVLCRHGETSIALQADTADAAQLPLAAP
jgi:hypothetical protein